MSKIIIYWNGEVIYADEECIYVPFFARAESGQKNVLQKTENSSSIPATEARDAQGKAGYKYSEEV